MSLKPIADILSIYNPATIPPHQPVWMVLQNLEAQGEGCVPVVSESGRNILRGVLRRIDIIRAYNNAVSKRAQDQHHNEILNIRKLNQSGLVIVTLNSNSHSIVKRVKELHLGGDALIVSIRLAGKLRIVSVETILNTADHVKIFAETPKSKFLENYLNGTLEDTELQEKTLVFHREVKIPLDSSIDSQKL